MRCCVVGNPCAYGGPGTHVDLAPIRPSLRFTDNEHPGESSTHGSHHGWVAIKLDHAAVLRLQLVRWLRDAHDEEVALRRCTVFENDRRYAATPLNTCKTRVRQARA